GNAKSRPAGMTIGRQRRERRTIVGWRPWTLMMTPFGATSCDGMLTIRSVMNAADQIVAAFDNEQEFRRLLETLAGDLERSVTESRSSKPTLAHPSVQLTHQNRATEAAQLAAT